MIGTIIIVLLLLGHQKLVKPIQGLLSQHNQEVKLKPNNGQTKNSLSQQIFLWIWLNNLFWKPFYNQNIYLWRVIPTNYAIYF